MEDANTGRTSVSVALPESASPTIHQENDCKAFSTKPSRSLLAVADGAGKKANVWTGTGRDSKSLNQVSHSSLGPIHRLVPVAQRLTAYLLQSLDRGTVIFVKALSQLVR